MKNLIILCLALSFNSFAQGVPKAKDITWNQANHPYWIVNQYTRIFRSLPLFGKIKNDPWSGDYWATYKGGISYRWHQNDKYNVVKNYGYKLPDMNELLKKPAPERFEYIKTLSPAEKFDLLIMGSNWPLTNSERKRTAVLKTVKGFPEYDSKHEIPTWFGLCHAWAPATILYENPSPVNMTNAAGISIPFGSSDIRALLTSNLDMTPKSVQKVGGIGARCEIDLGKLFEKFELGEYTKAQLEAEIAKNPECNDTNAGAFHVALTNLVGLYHEGFVMDYDRGSEVWNQGIYSFEAKILKRERISSHISKEIGQILHIENEVQWIKEIDPSWQKKKLSRGYGLYPSTYKYKLFLDRNGYIIGGEWLTQGKKDRPDFLWKLEFVPWNKTAMPILKNLYEASIGKGRTTLRYQKGELKKLWRNTARKVMYANKFVKNTKELVRDRKAKINKYNLGLKTKVTKEFWKKWKDRRHRMTPYYNKFKKNLHDYQRELRLRAQSINGFWDALENRNKRISKNITGGLAGLIKKSRSNIKISQGDIARQMKHVSPVDGRDEFRCHIMGVSEDPKVGIMDFVQFMGDDKIVKKGCAKAKARCEKWVRNKAFRSEQRECQYDNGMYSLKQCEYTMITRWLKRKVGTYSYVGLNEKIACKKALQNCESKIIEKRKCKNRKVTSLTEDSFHIKKVYAF